MRTPKGFTLIEILIVIALISIIAGIALPRFLRVTEKASIAQVFGELRTLQTAIESYMVFEGAGIPPLNDNGRHTARHPGVREKLEKAVPRIVADIGEFVDPFFDPAISGRELMTLTIGKQTAGST